MAGFGKTLLSILIVGLAAYIIGITLRLIGHFISRGSSDYWLVGFLFDRGKTTLWKLKIICIQIGILSTIALLWVMLRECG